MSLLRRRQKPATGVLVRSPHLDQIPSERPFSQADGEAAGGLVVFPAIVTSTQAAVTVSTP